MRTDLLDKELHRQVRVGIVLTSWTNMLCNGMTLTWNARDVRLIPALGTIFPIFTTPTTLSSGKYKCGKSLLWLGRGFKHVTYCMVTGQRVSVWGIMSGCSLKQTSGRTGQ